MLCGNVVTFRTVVSRRHLAAVSRLTSAGLFCSLSEAAISTSNEEDFLSFEERMFVLFQHCALVVVRMKAAAAERNKLTVKYNPAKGVGTRLPRL